MSITAPNHVLHHSSGNKRTWVRQLGNLDSDLSSIRISERNTPFDNNKNTLSALSAHTYRSLPRRYTNAKNIIDLAVEKFKKTQHGITFEDLRKGGLAAHKRQAQDTLKYYRRIGILFTIKLRRPQEYFASTIRSEVMQSISSKITPIDPTGVTHYCPNLSSRPSLSNCLENITIGSLEGYVLPLLKAAPSKIHNMHFKTKITPECYREYDIQELSDVPWNKGKQLIEIIGNARITYTFYPSGTVNIEVKCSNNPFKLETEIDRSHILVFFGQLRDRLITFLHDPHERIVQDIMEWFLTECDISRDIKVSDWLHYTGIKIQVKHLDHVFRIYVKSMGRETVCRVEEEKHPDKTAIEALNDIFNPYKKVEKHLAEQDKILHQILDKLALQPEFTTEERR
jgi:hypothetical protein